MHQEIINHLSSRPFAPILQHQLSLGENTIALKLMCIIDYLLEMKQLYPEILSQPKFLEQLLRFKNFEHFHYYEYRFSDFPFGDWMLACQCCEFIAPYKYTLEHMVLSHGRHLSAELCHWCGQNELREHTQFDTLSQCFHNYYFNKLGSYAGAQHSGLIKNVFAQFRYLATKLGVKTLRNTSYRASKSTAKEVLATGSNDADTDIAQEIYVTKTPIRVNKTMKMDQLDALFQKAIHHFRINVRNIQHLPFDQQSITSNTCASFDNYTTTRDIHTVPLMQSPTQIPRNPDVQQTMSSLRLVSPPAAAHDVQSLEIMNLASFLTSALQNMRSDTIRKKALIHIQQSILQYASEDLQSQINGTKND